MAKKLINEKYLTDIANAIRIKKGTTNAIIANDMANEIRSIPDGAEGHNVILNGIEKIAIADNNIPANNFIHLLDPVLLNEKNNLSLSGDLHKLEYIDDNKFIAFYKMGNTGITYHYFGINPDGTLRTYDVRELPCPFGTYEDEESIEEGTIPRHRYPTRIFKTNTNGFFFQAWHYWIPFIINSNNQLEFGQAYTNPALAPIVVEHNTPRYTRQNLISYGTYGDNWVFYNTIRDDVKPYKLQTVIVEVKNNTITNVDIIAAPDTTSIGHDNGNIYPLDEANGKYFMSYRENLNGTYITKCIPVQASVLNNKLQLHFGTINDSIACYFESGYNGVILKTDIDNVYCGINEDCTASIILNSNNVGYDTIYTGAPSPMTSIITQDNTNHTLYKINGAGIFAGFTYLNNNYYGWVTGETVAPNYNYYLAIAKLVDNNLIYLGRIDLFSLGAEVTTALKYINNYLYIIDNSNHLRIYKLDSNICKIKIQESGERIDGISSTDINGYDGTVWLRR